ncbi:MAG: hypothetical protein OET79_12695 [Nitrospirota bacterium]|nr:hypothetical protein [Nitrospirota bacterium]
MSASGADRDGRRLVSASTVVSHSSSCRRNLARRIDLWARAVFPAAFALVLVYAFV